ncbi:MAG: hypothetical protein JJT82_02185 [Legionellaceae bacterium]|nr:hypothetical protein [Legionellaceae bacterium]
MDIMGLFVTLISGAVGGNASAAAWKNISLGTLGNTIAGAVGGVAGTYILQAMNWLSSAGLADMTLASIMGNVGSGAVSGAVLTALIGGIKQAMSKS